MRPSQHEPVDARSRYANAHTDERRRFLLQELRRRRSKYLPVYEVWLGDMELYWRDVYAWRAHRQDCKNNGTKPFMELPEMPPCPSHLPSQEELLEMVTQGLSKGLAQQRRCSVQREGVVALGGRVARLARAELGSGVTEQRQRTESEGTDMMFKASDAESEAGQHLYEEVAGLLEPTAAHPAPVATSSVNRPAAPAPV